jgi:DNA end-binding protein Ku
MRSVWKGTIGFGTVAIPVKAYGATEEQSAGLHQLHLSDGGRIRMKRVCEADGAEVPFTEVGKGATLPGGQVVVLTEEDLATLPLSTTHSIEVLEFAPLDQIDPIYYAKSYYLEPDPIGTRPYVLLAESLRQSGKVAVVKVALRQRETIAVLRVKDHVLVLNTMLWPDEIRTPDFPFLSEDVPVRLRELRAATALIDRLATDFAPEKHRDRYREALAELISAKAEGREVVAPTEAEQDAGVAELLAALQAGFPGASEPDATEPDGTEPAAAAGDRPAAKPARRSSGRAAGKRAGADAETAAEQTAGRAVGKARTAADKAGAAKASAGRAAQAATSAKPRKKPATRS